MIGRFTRKLRAGGVGLQMFYEEGEGGEEGLGI